MASQVSHIVYAKKYFDRLDKMGTDDNNIPPENLNRDEFLLGCVFPDIRRIDDNIKRKDTHLRFPVLDLNFEGLSSFEAGWKFHLFCDMRREEILNKYDFYSLKYAADLYNHPAKMLEDEIVYENYNNWEKITGYFNNPPYFDSGVGVTKETFYLWYAILAKYVEGKPDDRSIRIFLNKQPRLALNEIMVSVEELRKNKKAVEILGKVCLEIV
ncbi:MAG: hypothetical protein QG620_114 [Patescibacteria group bacterium]|nr:hypothetical protein [Patescibacteria group bacterium]